MDVAARRRSSPSSSGPQHDDVARSVDSVRRILRVLRLAEQRTQQATGVSAAQLFVLQQLRGQDGESMSLSELADRTLTDRSSVTDVVERLLARGLVRRAVDTRDARRAAVSITSKGKALLRKAPQSPGALLVAALRKLPPSRLKNVGRALDQLTRAMGVDHAPAPMMFADMDGKRRK